MYRLGLDIGSTTAKIVLMKDGVCVFEKYERHYSRVREKARELIEQARSIAGNERMMTAISGSAGLGLAEAIDVPFVQEVFATGEAVRAYAPETNCVIELGGEDAKIIFFDGGIDERMNGTCAGGTGAFIDQMATLLNVSVEELDVLSRDCRRIYPIASRCGVFAKTDIQPLLNQGARKEDIAASIFQAVVNQTIAGLAQGRRIEGSVLFLGGPLYYCKGLRMRFCETLGLDDEHAFFSEYGRFAVSLGAAMYAAKNGEALTCDEIIRRIDHSGTSAKSRGRLKPLFNNREEYDEFAQRHSKAQVPQKDIASYSGNAYLGIDCGSTTTKLVLLAEDDSILYSYYASNRGAPVEIVKWQLETIYSLIGDRIKIKGSAVTGYGEELIKNAFGIDIGIVETIAHYTAAKHFRSNVDFILDIGGQDIKCFRIRNGAIDSIMLNEACSSGCGSFLETFASAMGMPIGEFAERGLHSINPSDLGSRCTVFMNSSVKQSQKDGATIEDISAGLSISVVKNALYKVIRVGSPDELGENIVVQGGTFHNDAVLRAFERELGKNVIRPAIAGLMGAFGAALYSKRCGGSTIISPEGLSQFTHEAVPAVCGGCQNHCHLTVNKFGGKRFISGNQCEKGAGMQKAEPDMPNLYEFKRSYISGLTSRPGKRGRIGLPLALGMYELMPMWHALFTELGFEVVMSDMSTRHTYEKGQFSIPSDTACYPAKIMHGHIMQLIEKGVDAIFYPCLTYNTNEMAGDNHYNCPVVAYYSELLNGNVEELSAVKFLYPYLNINSRRQLAKEIRACLKDMYPDIGMGEIKRAVEAAFAARDSYTAEVRRQGEAAVAYARSHGKRIMVLSGRPYHIDSEICHGIDRLAVSLGFAVVSEDSVCHLAQKPQVNVLNQWTYHARLYRAAAFAAENSDVELVQLVSFGCGIDAITTDEVRTILEKKDKFYTQLKIDEITNLGAVKIRLRSLTGALEEKKYGLR